MSFLIPLFTGVMMRSLIGIMQWNEDNHIKFLRVSSELFPFASHEKYGYTLEYAEKELKV